MGTAKKVEELEDMTEWYNAVKSAMEVSSFARFLLVALILSCSPQQHNAELKQNLGDAHAVC